MKIPTIEPTITLLRPAVSKATALLKERASLLKAESELRGQVDVAERSGSVYDDKLISQLAKDRARLSMFPAKLSHLENEIGFALEGIRAPLIEASRILAQHTADVRANVTEKLHKRLSPLVDSAAMRSEMIDVCLEYTSDVCEARALAGNFAPLTIREADDDQSLTELASRLVELFAPKEAE